jgi:hypothetical protein
MEAEDILKIDWKTTSLIAIDECRMGCDGKPTLTIGRSYHPTHYNTSWIRIFDDYNEEHHFEWDTLQNYFKIVANENLENIHTASRQDELENLRRAVGFDANNTYPALFQHLGYRKLIAEQLLRGGEINKMKELEELYKQVNIKIKLILGLL